MITIDLLADISELKEWTAIELALLVDSATEGVLKSGVFERSSDGVSWVSSP